MKLFGTVYAAGGDPRPSRTLNRSYRHCDERDIPVLRTLIATARNWPLQIMAYHLHRRLQRTHRGGEPLIEKLRRIGHGFRNFDNFRLRLLLRCCVTLHPPGFPSRQGFCGTTASQAEVEPQRLSSVGRDGGAAVE